MSCLWLRSESEPDARERAHEPVSCSPPASRMEARCYPSHSVCKRAVHALCALAGNDFTAADVWYDGRCTSRRRGCCLVAQLPGDIPGSKPRYSDQFYFGRDSEGYILVNNRANIDEWPRTCDGGERTLPIRLTRWITQAEARA